MSKAAGVDEIDLTDCDREPIHIPEAIQPHGLLLVLDRTNLSVAREAGRTATVTGRPSLRGLSIETVLGQTIAARLHALDSARQEGFAGRWRAWNGLDYDVVVRPTENHLVVEIEQSSQAASWGSS